MRRLTLAPRRNAWNLKTRCVPHGWSREKLSLEVAAGGWQTDYQNPTLVDSGRYYGEVAVRYAYSPKTEVGVFYQAGRLHIEGADSQTLQQVAGSLSWQPREKISIKINAGAEFRRGRQWFHCESGVGRPGRLDAARGHPVFLTAYQRQEVSALNDGQIYEVKGMTAGVFQRLGGNWAASLDAGYETASYIADPAPAPLRGRTGSGSCARPSTISSPTSLTDRFSIKLRITIRPIQVSVTTRP